MRIWLLISLVLLSPVSLSINDQNNRAIILSEERQQGEQLLNILYDECTFIEDTIAHEYFSSLIKRLLQNTELANHENVCLIIKNTALNAFAGPAGIVGINTGTFQACQHEGELAAILAHETAHLLQRHLQQLARRSKADTFTTILGLILGSLLTPINSDLGLGAAYTSLGSIAYQQLNYSRVHEKEADQVGLKILFNAGFNPLWMPKIFERFQQVSLNYRENFPKWFSTHPLDQERISYTYDQATTYPLKHYTEDYTYNLVRTRIAFLQNLPIQNEDPQINSIEKNYYQLLKNLQTNTNHTQTVAQLKFLKKALPNHFLISLAEAEYYFNRHDLNQALRILKQLYDTQPFNLAIILKYTELLNYDKQFEESQEILRSSYLQTNRLELLEALIKVYNLRDQKINSYLTQITLYEKLQQNKKALLLINMLLKNPKALQTEQLLKLQTKQKILQNKESISN